MPARWRPPEVTRIEDPIAEDHWQYITRKGEKRISRLAVGRPVHYPEMRVWYAPVLIEGHLPGIKPVFGEGPVDALMNAMTLVKRFSEENFEVFSVGSKPKAASKATTRKRRRKATASTVPGRSSRKRRTTR